MFKVLVGIVTVGAAIMGLGVLVYGTGAAFGIAASLITESVRSSNDRHCDRGAPVARLASCQSRSWDSRGICCMPRDWGLRLCSGWAKSFRP